MNWSLEKLSYPRGVNAITCTKESELADSSKNITLFEKDQKSYSIFVNELKYRNYGIMSVGLKKDSNMTSTTALMISNLFRESMKSIVFVVVLQVGKCIEK